MQDDAYTISDSKAQQNSIIEAKYNHTTFTVTPVENSVIAKAINGDNKAFEKLYMGTYRYVFSIARKYLKNDQDIYDAIQNTFTRVYKGLPRLEAASSFYPWLHRIATNCAKDILNTNLQNTTVSFDEQTNLDPDGEQNKKSDIAADVTAVLNQLPREQAELLILVFYDKMRISEIARMQGIPISTVHNRFKTAKRNLKQLKSIQSKLTMNC